MKKLFLFALLMFSCKSEDPVFQKKLATIQMGSIDTGTVDYDTIKLVITDPETNENMVVNTAAGKSTEVEIVEDNYHFHLELLKADKVVASSGIGEKCKDVTKEVRAGQKNPINFSLCIPGQQNQQQQPQQNQQQQPQQQQQSAAPETQQLSTDSSGIKLNEKIKYQAKAIGVNYTIQAYNKADQNTFGLKVELNSTGTESYASCTVKAKITKMVLENGSEYIDETLTAKSNAVEAGKSTVVYLTKNVPSKVVELNIEDLDYSSCTK